MAKAKKLTKKEHETMESIVSIIRKMEGAIVEASIVSNKATTELVSAKEAWQKLSEDLEKKYGSVEIDMSTGVFKDSAE